jgi:hypothetical protein
LRDDEQLDCLFPAEVFAEPHWRVTNEYSPTPEQDAAALAVYLREWLTTNLNLFRRWSEEQAFDFAKQVLPLYQQAFADDLIKDGGPLCDAFTVNGINEIRALIVVALPLLQRLEHQQRTGFAEIMGALRELRAEQSLPIRPMPFNENAAEFVDRQAGVPDSHSVPSFRVAELRYLTLLLDDFKKIEEYEKSYCALQGTATLLSGIATGIYNQRLRLLFAQVHKTDYGAAAEIHQEYSDIIEAFDPRAGLTRVLLLGEPGSGKCTTLRCLAQEVANTAQTRF